MTGRSCIRCGGKDGRTYFGSALCAICARVLYPVLRP